jgi:hypothetical protein
VQKVNFAIDIDKLVILRVEVASFLGDCKLFPEAVDSRVDAGSYGVYGYAQDLGVVAMGVTTEVSKGYRFVVNMR